MRKGRYLTAILAARLLIVFLAVSGMLSTHTISPSVPGQSGEAAKHKLDGSQDAAFAETRRLSQQGKFDEALMQLEALALKDPELRGLAHELGVTYYKKSDYLKATASFKKALEEDPGDHEAVQLMGLSYYLAGRPAEAIAPLEEVQTWYPSANVDAAYILGICYVQTKDYPSARKAFAKMFAVPPDSAASYLFTARMLLRQDFGPVAEEYAKKAVELDPKLPLGHSLLVLEKKGETALAARALERAIAMDPNNPMPHHLLGQTYREMGRTEEAERELKLSEQLQIHQNAKP